MDDPKDRLQSAVGDRYRIAHEIGQGGMARVFLADDLRHHRKVAIKVLLEGLSNNIGVRRFLQEIEVVAGLQHPHLLTLIDSGEVDGLPYFVMPYVEAQSLRALLDREGPLEVERALVIAREIADGLAYAHRNGIIHRDVKPSNILMSGGHAIVADFGIATALQKAATGALTQTGISVGSPTYMSPEHAADDAVDPRTDVYSLGCVLYEMVCGAPPFEGSAGQVLVRKLSGQFTEVRQKNPGVPAAVETAIHKALAPAPQDRFESMDAFAQAISAPARAQRPRRTRLIVIGAAALAVVAIAAGTRYSRVLWATQQLGEIDRLASAGELASAFALADEVRRIIPRNQTLANLRPAFTDYIHIATSPSGARVFRQRPDDDADWELLGTTPLDSVAMPKFGKDLTYRLRIEADGYRPAEVLPNLFADWAAARGVPRLDTLRLDPLEDAASAGMVRIPGWKAANALHPENDSITLADYHIGRTEVTNAEFKRFVDAGGYRDRKYWTESFVRDGHELSWEEGIAQLRDRSGLSGPSGWSGGTYPDGEDDFPVGGVSYYEAAAYARFVGKQIPTAAHWRRAAFRHDNEAGWIYMPTSNLSATGPRRIALGVANPYGLFDVAGNVREWCRNALEDGRVTLGGGWEDAEFLVSYLIPKSEFDRSPMNGMRLMSTTDADTTIAHVARPETRAVPIDFTKSKPVGDAEFDIYERLVDYDMAPLAARTDTSGVTEIYRWEKVSFEAAYDGQRMVAYIFLPKAAAPPYQPIIFWPGSGALGARSLPIGGFLEDYFVGKFLGFIPQGGRALVLPVFYGSFERDDSLFSVSGYDDYSTPGERDLAVRWIKDLRRTMDFLETRSDMAPEKTGLYGWSWGGRMAPMALTLEPRIKAAVLNTPGLNEFGSPLPEVDMVNYLPRVRVPVLMLNGRHDVVFPYESSQLPFYRMLGTPAADKKHLIYPTTHSVPQEANARETVAWFDKYLGRPASGK